MRSEFDEALLSAAGLLEAGPGGQGRLRPALAAPGGAVVALRRRPRARPSPSSAPRAACRKGCSGPRRRWRTAWPAPPAAGNCSSPRTCWRWRCCAPRLPGGLEALGADGLRDVDAGLGRAATLVLLGWRPLLPAAGPAEGVGRAAARLVAAREHLGLGLDGVAAWAPPAEELDNLRFRLVRELLRASARELLDLEALCPRAAPPPPGYAAARERLLAALAHRREGSWALDELREAAEAYAAAVRRELVAPLQKWALSSGDPVERAAGAELANAAGLLHQMAPLLADLQAARLAWPRGAEAEAPPLFAQYLTLAGRFGGLVRDLARWRARQ